MDDNGQTLIERHTLTLEHGGTIDLEERLSFDTLRVNTTNDKIAQALVKDAVDNQEVATTAHVIFVSDKYTYINVTGEY